ncbi:MAG: hypothetical protein QOG43_3591 [Actinomycetota bacterium]|nr:hypothetical protein [Actinomycetota bacterium]
MAKSAVFTQPSRIFLPVASASMLLAIVYGAFTGDWLGITLYLLLVVVAGFAGVVVAGFRVNDAPEWVAPDADPPAYHEVARVALPAGGAWPFTAALAVTLLLLGLVVGPLPAYFGLGLGLVTVAGWLAQVAADTTGRQINLLPIGIPVLGLFCIASLMFFMSRILLAVPEEASTFIALAVAVTILSLASMLALRPTVSRRTMVSVLGVAGVLMIAGGLVAAAAGERKIEHEGEVVEAAAATLVAKNIAFDHKEISLPANTEVDVDFKNTDKGIPHNVAIYGGADATAPVVFKGDILAGPAETKYHFTSPAAGDYHFQCDVHPNMSGTVKVA